MGTSSPPDPMFNNDLAWSDPAGEGGLPGRVDLTVRMWMQNLVRCRAIIWLAPSLLMMMAPPELSELQQNAATAAVVRPATTGTECTAGPGVRTS